ncbi:MAG TPA: histidinol-phosphate transaminase [Alphaproteobacteria bacterium]|nr:histidinol-phosphate transaminase [Alphaproteobacteria bacterium]
MAQALAPRPGILAIEPYKGGESAVPGVDRIIKLSSNEGALGPSPRAIAAIEAASREAHRYPDGESKALREALGRRYGLDPARIVCGAGSDELISLLTRAYAGPGDEILYSEYGFLMYAISAHSVGAVPVAAPEKGLRADIEALLAKVSAKTRILFLANPNNPTGSFLAKEEVARLHAGLPGNILLVIDAAYAEYVTRNDYSAGAELVEAHDNVVMTRTFSKIYGLGGLRLGWAYCSPGVADVLNRVRNPFNVTNVAQAAGLAALDDIAHVDAVRTNNDIWLPWVTAELGKLGLDVAPSVGNFVLVRFPDAPAKNADAANAFLCARGIIPRKMGVYNLPHSLRITIGREDEMRALVAALAEFMS